MQELRHGVYRQLLPQCGQSARIGRLTFLEFVKDAVAGLVSVNRSFFYTGWKLFTKPSDTVLAYIDGRRVEFTKPLTLVFVLAGLYHLLVWGFHIPTGNMTEVEPLTFTWETFQFGKWIFHHYDIQLLCDIPFWALFTWWVFRSSKKSYTEHLVLNAYITSQRVIIMLLTVPLKMCFCDNAEIINLLWWTDLILGFLVITRMFILFFKEQKYYWVLLKEIELM